MFIWLQLHCIQEEVAYMKKTCATPMSSLCFFFSRLLPDQHVKQKRMILRYENFAYLGKPTEPDLKPKTCRNSI